MGSVVQKWVDVREFRFRLMMGEMEVGNFLDGL